MLKILIIAYFLILSLLYSPSVSYIEIIRPTRPVVLNPHPFATNKDPYREDLHGNLACSCIRTVRSLGFKLPYGTNAEDLKPNTKIAIGTLALFKFSNASHVAVVVKIEENGFWVREGNYPTACEFSERFVKYDDWFLIGFYSYPQN